MAVKGKALMASRCLYAETQVAGGLLHKGTQVFISRPTWARNGFWLGRGRTSSEETGACTRDTSESHPWEFLLPLA